MDNFFYCEPRRNYRIGLMPTLSGRFRYASFTGQRSTQEDALLLCGEVFQGEAPLGEWCPLSTGSGLAVLDGLGGHAAGDIAARSNARVLATLIPHWQTEADISPAFHRARQTLNGMVRANPRLLGMGSTVTGLKLFDNAALFFHCGDSRFYWGDDHTCRRISQDHTRLQALLDRGEISVGEARHHPGRHQLSRAVTGNLHAEPPVVDTGRLDIAPATYRFLLCTDGVWDVAGEERLLRLLNPPPDAQATSADGANDDGATVLARILTDSALPDNASFIWGEITSAY